MDDSMEELKRFYDTDSEISHLFDIEVDKKEYDDMTIRSIKGERFACRNYLCDWYSQLTEEQKKFITKFRVIYSSARVEDDHDREYNVKNYKELNNYFSTKGVYVDGRFNEII